MAKGYELIMKREGEEVGRSDHETVKAAKDAARVAYSGGKATAFSIRNRRLQSVTHVCNNRTDAAGRLRWTKLQQGI